MTDFPLKTCKSLWFPISELKDKYSPHLMLASPQLVDLDFNPYGVSTGYWQDDEGWVVNGWDGCNDEPVKVILSEDDVTHFRYVEGPDFASTGADEDRDASDENKKITVSELHEYFGDTMPGEAYFLIAKNPDTLTLPQLRKKMRKMGKEWKDINASEST